MRGRPRAPQFTWALEGPNAGKRVGALGLPGVGGSWPPYDVV